jgi:hypothetical protein
MNKKQGAPEPTPIKEVADYQTLLDETSQTKVVIIDLHQDWCGPAAAIKPFWNTVWLEQTNALDRIELASLNLSNKELTDLAQKGCEVTLSASCKPVFILLRLGQVVGTVDGLNTSNLAMMLDLHIPRLPKKEEK